MTSDCCELETSLIGCNSFLLVALFVSSTVLWSIGSKLEYFEQIPFLISIPLYTAPNSKYGMLYGLPEHMLPVQENYTSFSISTTFLSDYRGNVNLYIFHNLWGYNFNIQATDSAGRKVLNSNFSLNQNLGSAQNSSVSKSLLLNYPVKIYGNDMTGIFCPFKTQITTFLGLNCTSQLAFAYLNPNVSSLKIGSYDFNKISSDLKFNFTNFTAYPYDYIATPQAFITGYRETIKKKLLIAGPTLFVIFLIWNIVNAIIMS